MSTSGLPEEQLRALKHLIHDHLHSSGVYDSLREIVANVVEESPDGMPGSGEDPTGTEAVIRALQQKGIIADLIRALAPQSGESGPLSPIVPIGHASPSVPTLLKGERYLYVSLLGGKAFLDHITQTGASGREAKLMVCAQLGSQRARSQPVPGSVEPAFSDSFLFKLQADVAGVGMPGSKPVYDESLLGHKQLLHIVVLKLRGAEGAHDREIVGTHLLEWRKVLTTGPAAACVVSVEVSGVLEEARLPVGVLDMKLELLPPPAQDRNGGAPSERELAAQLKRERTEETDAERAFFAYARSWWQEYQGQRAGHGQRLVKIFAQTEFGVQRPVTTFVRPLYAGRLLESAAHAARFVALIPFHRQASVGDRSTEMWSTLHSFLCKGRGDADDHALLLCSLLLGFGLDAYVAVGSDTQGGHMWVITRASRTRTVFWESLSGQRTVHDIQSLDYSAGQAHYRTVGCLFNNDSLYANVQVDDSVQTCSFYLEDPKLWKAMDRSLLARLTPMPPTTLAPTTLSPPGAAEEAVEKDLRRILAQHREPLGLATFWDDRLCALLAPALAAYEAERVTGSAYGNEEFQQAIKLHVPEGHTFKGFPQLFTHTAPANIVFSLLKSDVALDIIQSRGDHVRHAVRCKVVNYPDDICAVWVMVAVEYKPRQSHAPRNG